jgi:hypothetical protein
MDKEELLRLAYIRVAQAATLLAGEDLLAEEAEALADKVNLAEAAARTSFKNTLQPFDCIFTTCLSSFLSRAIALVTGGPWSHVLPGRSQPRPCTEQYDLSGAICPDCTRIAPS